MSRLRSDRHRDAVSDLVRASLQIAEKEGWAELDLRSLAKKLRFSTIVVYRHVGSKQGLITAIQDHGFQALRDAFRREAGHPSPPKTRLRRMSLAFMDFADRKPALYKIMFGLAGVQSAHPPYESIMAAGGIVKEVLSRISPAGDVDQAFLGWWAICQGFISIRLNPEMTPEYAPLRRAFSTTLERYLLGLERAPTKRR